MLLALLIDSILGWPSAIHARIGHPVTWIGAMIAALDQSFNREDASEATRRAAGIGVALAVIMLAAGVGLACAADAARRMAGSDVRRDFGLAACRRAFDARPCRWRGAAVDSRRSAGGTAGGFHDCRTRSLAARCGRDRKGCDRKPCREHVRRNRGAAVLGRDLRPAGHCRLQGHQHAGLHDRPSHPKTRSFRMGGGAHRRRREPDPGAADGIVVRGRLHSAAQRWRRCGAMRTITVRPTPAGRKPRWRARSAFACPGPAFTRDSSRRNPG